MNPVATTGVGVSIAGATATLQWIAQSRGIQVPDAVAGFIVALMIGACHGVWRTLTVFVPRLGANGMLVNGASANLDGRRSNGS